MTLKMLLKIFYFFALHVNRTHTYICEVPQIHYDEYQGEKYIDVQNENE